MSETARTERSTAAIPEAAVNAAARAGHGFVLNAPGSKATSGAFLRHVLRAAYPLIVESLRKQLLSEVKDVASELERRRLHIDQKAAELSDYDLGRMAAYESARDLLAGTLSTMTGKGVKCLL